MEQEATLLWRTYNAEHARTPTAASCQAPAAACAQGHRGRTVETSSGGPKSETAQQCWMKTNLPTALLLPLLVPRPCAHTINDVGPGKPSLPWRTHTAKNDRPLWKTHDRGREGSPQWHRIMNQPFQCARVFGHAPKCGLRLLANN